MLSRLLLAGAPSGGGFTEYRASYQRYHGKTVKTVEQCGDIDKRVCYCHEKTNLTKVSQTLASKILVQPRDRYQYLNDETLLRFDGDGYITIMKRAMILIRRL